MSFTAGTICNLKGHSDLLEMTCRLELGVSNVAAIWRVEYQREQELHIGLQRAPLKNVAEY